MRNFLPIGLFALLAASVSLLACSEGTPVAPTGTVLTITASPSNIPLNGASEITVVGRRPDGNPLFEGTEIRFSTSLGSIVGIVETDNAGVARALLTADNRTGVATVTATTGSGDTSAETTVQVGESAETQLQLTLVAEPSEIDTGETSTISAIVRRPDGSSAGSGQVVRFFASLGSIAPSASTDSDGIARAQLSSGDDAGTAEVTAFVGSSAAATASVVIEQVGASVIEVGVQPSSAAAEQAINAEVTVTVFDQDGDLADGLDVSFSTRPSTGSFSPPSAVSQNGRVVATWTVPAGVTQAGTITITARATSSAGGTREGTTSFTVTSGGGG
jgi:hypothetical protein